MSPETAAIIEDLCRTEQRRIDARKNTPHARHPHLTQAEGDYIDHISRWASAAYPVFRRGGKWWVDELCNAGGCPSGFKTKREAVCDVNGLDYAAEDKCAYAHYLAETVGGEL